MSADLREFDSLLSLLKARGIDTLAVELGVGTAEIREAYIDAAARAMSASLRRKAGAQHGDV